MAGYQCPFCQMVMPINRATQSNSLNCFECHNFNISTLVDRGDVLELIIYRCPNCERISIYAKGIKGEIKDLSVNIHPSITCKQFPNFVPSAIRSDYEEAYAIMNLSPKASATLSRRCLQGMIRDFWGITKSRLVDEINALREKIPAQQWKVIDSIRKLGNIGAHMEKDINLIVDIDPYEAEQLIKLIELLIKDWYIAREDQKNLYADIIRIAEDKTAKEA